MPDPDPRTLLFILAGAAALLAAFAAFAERRRAKRRYLDKVGWVPWNFIQVVSFLTVLVALALALKL